MNKIKKEQYFDISQEQILKDQIKNGGRFGGSKACKLVFEFNKKIFANWNNKILGDKNHKLEFTRIYDKEFNVQKDFNYQTKFGCYNKDCADVAEELLYEGLNPAILNLASNVSPGGGYHKGTSAQEECLCQMSTLSQSLYQFGSLKYKHIRESGVPNIPNVYPMDINYGGIYSPDVVFFRNNKKKYFSIRDNIFSCAIITVASLSNRQKNEYTNDERKYFNLDGSLTEEGLKIEANKIRTIYRIALDNGHDSIVLGAFGCGVYHLLPSEVAKLFNDILNESEFKNKFKKIVFAILEGRRTINNPTGPDGKFKPFYDYFG